MCHFYIGCGGSSLMYFVDNENVIVLYFKYFWTLLTSVQQLLLNCKIGADVLMQTLLMTTLVHLGVLVERGLA